MNTQSSIAKDAKPHLLNLLNFAILALCLVQPAPAQEKKCGGDPEKCPGTFALCIAASCSSDFTSCPSSYRKTGENCTLCGAESEASSEGGTSGYCYVFTDQPGETLASCFYPGTSVGPSSCKQLEAHLPTVVYSTYSPKLLNDYGFQNLTCQVGGSADCMGATCTPTGEYAKLFNRKTQMWDEIETAACTCIVTSETQIKGTTQGAEDEPNNCPGTVWSTF